MIFNKTYRNLYRKINQYICINFILELVIKSRLEINKYFILEEDNNFEYKLKRNNIIQDKKAKYKLAYYFNCLYFLNL